MLFKKKKEFGKTEASRIFLYVGAFYSTGNGSIHQEGYYSS